MREFDYDIVANPEIFQQNRLDPHSDHRFYASQEEAEQEQSSFEQCLNGDWFFSYAPNLASSDREFYQAEVDCKDWKTIPVPAHMQMEGYGIPQYCNTQYPWDGSEEILPGEIPVIDNPVGHYVKYIHLPEGWEGHPVFIRFDGVESAMALWCNGHYVGYAEDSFTPSSFDLSAYVQAGENKLALQVFRFSSGSWYEDQDFYRFSGIFRDVTLYTIPRLHLKDLALQTHLSEDLRRAELTMDLKILGEGRGRVSLELWEGEHCLAKRDQSLDQEGLWEQVIHVDGLFVDHPRLWSAEHPFLYQLAIRIYDEQGQLLEYIKEPVGFRQFALVDGIMTLNGKRIVFKGVNRHEFSSSKGRAISQEDIWHDLVLMKQNNINAVRTSHYPNQSCFYRYCDLLGLYVIDENNMETHGYWDSVLLQMNPLESCIPGDRPEALAMMQDRIQSMYQRDKNHASILIWSCGNESLGGSVIYEMSQLLRRLDPSRLVHYEGVVHDPRYPDSTDIYSTMYHTTEQIKEALSKTDKPYINCEYTHAMGNSCGAMHKYTDLTDQEPRFQGGFIWDFADQSITATNRFGEKYESYGGDLGDRPCDYSFSGNGIVYGGDGHKLSPKMQEVKYNYRSIKLSFEGEQVRIANRFLFTDLSEFAIQASLKREGVLLAEEEMNLSLAPGEEIIIDLPIPIPMEAGEYVEEISFALKEDCSWAKKGHEISYGQGVYGTFSGRDFISNRAAAMEGKLARAEEREEDGSSKKKYPGFDHLWGKRRAVTLGDQTIYLAKGWMNLGVYGEHFSALFSGRFGGLISYSYHGKMLFSDIPRPNFWRAMTENDLGNLLPTRAGQWKLASSYSTHSRDHGRGMDFYQIEIKEDCVQIKYTYHLATVPSKDCWLTYQVFADGTVRTQLDMEPTVAIGELPEFGVLFAMDADFDQLQWYGCGPEETYWDRPHGKLDCFANRVADNMAKYLRPSECGNKIDVRWASCCNEKGQGILFAMEKTPLSFNALPYSPDMLDYAQHAYELPRVYKTWIRVAMAQMGVGGDDSWGALTHEEYQIDNSKALSFAFYFRGL